VSERASEFVIVLAVTGSLSMGLSRKASVFKASGIVEKGKEKEKVARNVDTIALDGVLRFRCLAFCICRWMEWKWVHCTSSSPSLSSLALYDWNRAGLACCFASPGATLSVRMFIFFPGTVDSTTP